MVDAPRLKLLQAEFIETPVHLRMPFRFGAITVREVRQATVRVRIRTEAGRESHGFAAEVLAAKWFDKNPALTDAQNVADLKRSLFLTAEAYLASGFTRAFDLFAAHHQALALMGAERGMAPLVTGYGSALIDRAVLDALCRLQGLSFWQAVQCNLPGIRLDALDPQMASMDMGTGAWLESLTPARHLHLRHTVGMLDPMGASDVEPADRVGDGLPQTLQEVLETYGNRYFKIKLGGQADADLARLEHIASVLDTLGDPYRVTLDGNEQYPHAEAIAGFWQRMARTPRLQRLCASTLFFEQPISRARALQEPVTALACHRPVIIDESDADLSAFVQARALGYQGVSSKSCKGFYKSLLNLARCHLWNTQASSQSPGPRFFMSAEDLTTLPGLSLQQDLALASLLGVTHVERNAHHFVRGFEGQAPSMAEDFLSAHGDLYERRHGLIGLRMRGGSLDVGSLKCAGYGASVVPRGAPWQPMAG